ncbi:MAG: hypothetical protein M3256_10920 [Actinomycetota bacterium]|nr:hypothetical protein [Actinomycetota bacterium]
MLAGHAGHDDVVDVTVVEGAVRRHDGVVTSNKAHIEKVAQAGCVKLRIETV